MIIPVWLIYLAAKKYIYNVLNIWNVWNVWNVLNVWNG